jgi:hypothetical protein
MKRLIITTAALALLTAPALAGGSGNWGNGDWGDGPSDPVNDNSIGAFNQVIDMTQIGVINLGIAGQARFGEVDIETDGNEFIDLEDLEQINFQGAIYSGGDVEVTGVLFADDVEDDVQVAGDDIINIEDVCEGISNCDPGSNITNDEIEP